MTSLRPDQTSSTAHTFTSTSPSGSAISRMVSSVMSVGVFEAFFGHEIQIAPSGFSLASVERTFAARSARRVAKRCAMSVSPVIRDTNFTSSGSGATSLA